MLFHQAGIDETQFSVQQISPEALAQSIATHSVAMVLVDGKLDKLQSIAQVAYQFKFTEKSMLKLLTPFDSPDLYDYRAYAEQFSRVRSFAINTMRHGAPLEIDI